MWTASLEDWANHYECRLEMSLSAIQGANSEKIKRSTVQVVLLHARELDAGAFWLNHAARKSCAFDASYWRCLDGRLFRSDTKSL